MTQRDAGRRILIVNPNTSDHITRLMVAEGVRMAPAGVEVVGATAPFGAPSLECLAELTVAGHAVLTVLADHLDCGAAIIGAFGDPGLAAAVDIMPMPVFGIGRCGLLAAADGARRRFSIVTLGPHMRASLERAAQDAGVGEALANIAFLSASVLELARDPAGFHAQMLALARDCVSGHGAQAVLFAGAPFSGIGNAGLAGLDVPVFDGLSSAMSAALSVPVRARASGEIVSGGKAMVGISEALARLITARLKRG